MVWDYAERELVRGELQKISGLGWCKLAEANTRKYLGGGVFDDWTVPEMHDYFAKLAREPDCNN